MLKYIHLKQIKHKVLWLSIVVILIIFTLLCVLHDSGAKNKNHAIARVEYVSQLPKVPLPKFPPPNGENFILIVVDTLRVDRLGCYGFSEKPISPNIDELAGQGIVFDAFYAAAPWTAPSFATILTGVSPTIHHTGLPLKKEKKGTVGRRNLFPISNGIPTLPELIQKDMNTAAFVTNGFLGPELGFNRGFRHYDQKTPAGYAKHRRANKITQQAIKWIKKNGNTPFFILLHYFDPHLAYDPPTKVQAQFVPRESDGLTLPYMPDSKTKRTPPNETRQEFIKGAYNGEVRFVDEQIGRLFRRLKKLGHFDNTWIVVTSDHGEEHFEHGGFEHGHRYEDEVMRVPLIIRAPGGKWGAGRRIPYSASHVDLAPTILELFGKELPNHFEGKSLWPMITGTKTDNHAVYMEYNMYGEQLHAYFDGRFKMIRTNDMRSSFMYDLAKDPGELKKLGADHPAFVKIEQQLDLHLEKRKERISEVTKNDTTSEIPISEELQNSLKSLGYIH